jgi:hypothetical protein
MPGDFIQLVGQTPSRTFAAQAIEAVAQGLSNGLRLRFPGQLGKLGRKHFHLRTMKGFSHNLRHLHLDLQSILRHALQQHHVTFFH